MASPSLKIFCTSKELASWLKLLAENFTLEILMFIKDNNFGSIYLPNDFEDIPNDALRLFLYPKDTYDYVGKTLNDVSSRDCGWVDVTPGCLLHIDDQEILILSKIDAEDFEVEPVHPSCFVRWLKKKLTGKVTFGVVGYNVLTEGSSTYKNIGYTDMSKSLLDTGVIWKTYKTDRTKFLPSV